MTKPSAELIVQVTASGLRRVVVDTAKGQRGDGFALLGRVLPALEELNRAAQKLSESGT